MTILTRPEITVNLENLLSNYHTLQTIAPRAEAAAVVKDDAYGLGAVAVAEKLYSQGGCRRFFVAHAREGEEIRPVVPEAEIYVLQGIGVDNLEACRRARLTPVISSPQMLAFWKQNTIPGIRPAVNIETGLNRLGFRENELAELSPADRESFCFVMSHLACGDEKDHFMNRFQLDNFVRLKQRWFPDLPASLSASDGTFLGTDYQFDIVRLGAALYGLNTAPYRENQMKNVVSLSAPVLQTADLPQGSFVGYSATYRATSDRRIAIISVGYGDGLPRSLSNVGKVFFSRSGKLFEARILGRISMDNVICDITDIPEVEPGAQAWLLFDSYTADDMGRDAGTIGYEILSRIGKSRRAVRRYI